MMTRLIPSTRESLPVIGLGSYQTFDVGSGAADRDGPRAVIDAFVRADGKLIDSSPMYGNEESVIGECLHELALQQKIFIATKVWTSGREAGIQQMEASQRKLRTTKLDLIQVHNLLDADTHLRTLDEWKEAGRVRYAGITHYTASGHAAVEKILKSRPIDFVQINYSLVEREAERRLLPLAAERGVAVIVNRPFAGGSLLNRLSRRVLVDCAAELQCDSWAQLALKFIISHPAVTCVIPATSNAAHLRDFLRAGVGPLPDAAMRERIAATAN
jgi:aryl-alcohol dehydrogenase-like predicted oxidoreductase